jgi:hypothetical protein
LDVAWSGYESRNSTIISNPGIVAAKRENEQSDHAFHNRRGGDAAIAEAIVPMVNFTRRLVPWRPYYLPAIEQTADSFIRVGQVLINLVGVCVTIYHPVFSIVDLPN